MNDTTLGIIALFILLVVAAGIVALSVVFMSSESRRTAEINQQLGAPVSNGYALVAVAAVAAVAVFTIIFGLLPPLLRR